MWLRETWLKAPKGSIWNKCLVPQKLPSRRRQKSTTRGQSCCTASSPKCKRMSNSIIKTPNKLLSRSHVCNRRYFCISRVNTTAVGRAAKWTFEVCYTHLWTSQNTRQGSRGHTHRGTSCSEMTPNKLPRQCLYSKEDLVVVYFFLLRDIPQELQVYSWLGQAILFNTSHSFWYRPCK